MIHSDIQALFFGAAIFQRVDLQVRATDTDVDDGVDLLAGVTLPLAAADLLGELLHVLQHGVDILDDALAIDLHGLVGDIAESNVVDGTVLGEVDGLALEHGITQLLDIGLLGQLDQERQGLLGQEVLGEIEEDVRVVDSVGEGPAEPLEALRVLLKGLLEDDVASHGVVVLLELLPGGKFSSLRETRHCGRGLVEEGLLPCVFWSEKL